MEKSGEFHRLVIGMLDEIQATQMNHIKKVADVIADKTVKGSILFAFGTGHSHVIAEEIYIRAGGLFTAKGILEPEFMLHGTKWKSTALERIEGIAKSILTLNGVRPKDIIIIISNSGRNPVPIEMALEATKMGMEVVCITNIKHSKSTKSRHKSGKKLYQVCQHVIDNCGVPGDAAMGVEGAPYKFGATSTITGAFIVQQLVNETIMKIKARGEVPPVLLSSNLDDSDAYNEDLLKSYFERFPELEWLLR